MGSGNGRANLRPMVMDAPSLRDTFRKDVLSGLSREQKATPAKHLYDARGSEIFQKICELEEYYPTRTERAILERSIAEMAAALGPEAVLIEPGAGSGEKAAMLLEHMDRPRAFVPIEISPAALRSASGRLAERFPETEIRPVCASFLAEGVMPRAEEGGARVVYFPGSTIGNFDGVERERLLWRFREMAGDEGHLLIGFDLKKDEGVLRRAYNDSEGVTAAFNKNLLVRINRELGGTFDPTRFEHDAPWIDQRSRIEMRLVSREEQAVEVGGRTFAFRRGEWIHTENSYKFEIDGMDAEAAGAGFERLERWQDERGWFCVALYRAVPTGSRRATG